MATVRNTITLQDKFTPVMRSVIKALNSTVIALASVDNMSSSAFKQMQRDVMKASDAVEELNNDTRELKNASDGAGKGFGNMGANLGGSIYAAKELYNVVSNIALKLDEINARGARANMVAAIFGNTTAAEIQKEVQKAAIESRGNYALMLDSVGKMGIMAKDAFKSPKELIDFNTQLQKMFVIAGAGQAQIDSATLQLTQALGSGILRGEEFNAVFEASPNIIQAIAKYTGKTTGEMRKMAEQGMLTAEVVKYAMLEAANETNAAFEKMPMSFTAVMNLIKLDMENALGPIAQAVGEFWGMMASNWDTVRPILYGLGAGLLFVAAAIAVVTVGQWAWNAALMASPITWVILAVGALIAVLVGLGLWLYDLWQTNMEFKYGVIKIWNGILGFFDQVPIFFMGVGGGILDAFSFAKVGVANVMQEMINGVLSDINSLIRALNSIPGVAIQPLSAVSFAASVAAEEEAARQARGAGLEAIKQAANDKAAARQAEMEASRIVDTANVAVNKAKMEAEGKSKTKNPTFGELDIKGGKLDSVGKIDSDITLSEEDIKMLRDVAAVEFINKYTTMTPNMQITFGDVRETADVEGIISAIETMVEEAYASSLVGEVL